METKYKIIETTGCTAFGLTVNGKDLDELSEQEYDEMLDYLFVKMKEGLKESTISFNEVMQLFQSDEWEHDPEPCGQCGDTVSSETWNI